MQVGLKNYNMFYLSIDSESFLMNILGIRILLQYKDAADGRTWIKPYLHFNRIRGYYGK